MSYSNYWELSIWNTRCITYLGFLFWVINLVVWIGSYCEGKATGCVQSRLMILRDNSVSFAFLFVVVVWLRSRDCVEEGRSTLQWRVIRRIQCSSTSSQSRASCCGTFCPSHSKQLLEWEIISKVMHHKRRLPFADFECFWTSANPSLVTSLCWG